MAKRNNSIPQVPEEFRQQYKSEYACLPIKWRERFAPLPDEVAGRILKAVLEHCVTGSTNPPEGVDAFAFGFILDEVDAYQEKGLQFAWARYHKAQNASRTRWKGGEDAQESSRMHKDAQESHISISTSIPTSTSISKENTNTNNAREKSRGDGGEGGSLGVEEIKKALKAKAAALPGFSHGQKPRSKEELKEFCRALGHPDFTALSFWDEMEFHGWEIQEGGEWRPVKNWQNLIIHTIATEQAENPQPPQPEIPEEYAHYQ